MTRESRDLKQAKPAANSYKDYKHESRVRHIAPPPRRRPHDLPPIQSQEQARPNGMVFTVHEAVPEGGGVSLPPSPTYRGGEGSGPAIPAGAGTAPLASTPAGGALFDAGDGDGDSDLDTFRTTDSDLDTFRTIELSSVRGSAAGAGAGAGAAGGGTSTAEETVAHSSSSSSLPQSAASTAAAAAAAATTASKSVSKSASAATIATARALNGQNNRRRQAINGLAQAASGAFDRMYQLCLCQTAARQLEDELNFGDREISEEDWLKGGSAAASGLKYVDQNAQQIEDAVERDLAQRGPRRGDIPEVPLRRRGIGVPEMR